MKLYAINKKTRALSVLDVTLDESNGNVIKECKDNNESVNLKSLNKVYEMYGWNNDSDQYHQIQIQWKKNKSQTSIQTANLYRTKCTLRSVDFRARCTGSDLSAFSVEDPMEIRQPASIDESAGSAQTSTSAAIIAVDDFEQDAIIPSNTVSRITSTAALRLRVLGDSTSGIWVRRQNTSNRVPSFPSIPNYTYRPDRDYSNLLPESDDNLVDHVAFDNTSFQSSKSAPEPQGVSAWFQLQCLSCANKRSNIILMALLLLTIMAYFLPPAYGIILGVGMGIGLVGMFCNSTRNSAVASEDDIGDMLRC